MDNNDLIKSIITPFLNHRRYILMLLITCNLVLLLFNETINTILYQSVAYQTWWYMASAWINAHESIIIGLFQILCTMTTLLFIAMPISRHFSTRSNANTVQTVALGLAEIGMYFIHITWLANALHLTSIDCNNILQMFTQNKNIFFVLCSLLGAILCGSGTIAVIIGLLFATKEQREKS